MDNTYPVMPNLTGEGYARLKEDSGRNGHETPVGVGMTHSPQDSSMNALLKNIYR